MPSPEFAAPVIRPAKELIATARPAVFLPVVREGFGRGDVPRDCKDEGEGTPGIAIPIAIEFRRPLTEGRGLDITGQVRDTDVVQQLVHGNTSFNFAARSFQLAASSSQLIRARICAGEGKRAGGRGRGHGRTGNPVVTIL